MKIVNFSREEVLDMLAEHLADCIQSEIHQSGNEVFEKTF